MDLNLFTALELFTEEPFFLQVVTFFSPDLRLLCAFDVRCKVTQKRLCFHFSGDKPLYPVGWGWSLYHDHHDPGVFLKPPGGGFSHNIALKITKTQPHLPGGWHHLPQQFVL